MQAVFEFLGVIFRDKKTGKSILKIRYKNFVFAVGERLAAPVFCHPVLLFRDVEGAVPYRLCVKFNYISRKLIFHNKKHTVFE